MGAVVAEFYRPDSGLNEPAVQFILRHGTLFEMVGLNPLVVPFFINMQLLAHP